MRVVPQADYFRDSWPQTGFLSYSTGGHNGFRARPHRITSQEIPAILVVSRRLCLAPAQSAMDAKIHRPAWKTLLAFRDYLFCVGVHISRNSCWRSRSSAVSSRSEEHTSELQSLAYLVCRLLLEKKNKRRVAQVARRRTP